jgi:TPP-dependent pyruvate/acetoin dehydrogenase alpha subunit
MLTGHEVSERRTHDLGSLADAAAFHDPIEIEQREPEVLLTALRRMLVIRRVEEIIADGVKDGIIRCPCHLAIGQEACAVGIALVLTPLDRCFGAHRSHGHFLALGGNARGLFAEVLGRDTGVSRGMGGSMHLVDRSVGLYGTVPIVSATIPIAVGAGLASKMDKDGSIAVSFFGDGATEEGVFHESMNLASVLRAPVLFVCENNLFSSHLRIGLRQPHDSTARFADAHKMPSRRVDGNDLLAVWTAAGELVTPMRESGGPAFIELVTYRWRGHVGWRDDEDVGVARKHDLPEWKRRDPIGRFATGLFSAGFLSEDELARMNKEIDDELRNDWDSALKDPTPEPSALLDRVYAHDATKEHRHGEHGQRFSRCLTTAPRFARDFSIS